MNESPEDDALGAALSGDSSVGPQRPGRGGVSSQSQLGQVDDRPYFGKYKPLSPGDRKRLEEKIEDMGAADVLGLTWSHAPVCPWAYVGLAVSGMYYQHLETSTRTSVSRIQRYVPDAVLNELPGLTSISHCTSVLNIVSHIKKLGEDDYVTKGTELILGPLAEALQPAVVESQCSPTVLANAAESLVTTGDTSAVESLLSSCNNGTLTSTATTTVEEQETPQRPPPDQPDGRAGPIELTSSSSSTSTRRDVESVLSVSKSRFNGVGPVPSRPYGTARSPYATARRPGFYAVKQRLELLPEKTIEELLSRTPDGSMCPWADVPTGLYERIVRWAPAVGKHEPLGAIFQHNLLAYGRDEDWHRTEDNTGIIIPHEKIFAAFGMAPRTAWNRGITSGMLLELYRQKVDHGFRVTGWNETEGKARVIKGHSIPARILQDAKELMLSPEDYDDWTYLINGKSANNRRWTRQLREERREVIEDNTPAVLPPEATRRMQSYLNGLHQKTFGHGAYGIFAPSEIDNALEKAQKTIAEEQRRDQERRKLYWMRKFPQPMYMACDRFPRLKADHHNQAMNLPSKILQAVYGERDYELDLSKAHLAGYVPTVERFGIDAPVLRQKLRAGREGEIDLWAKIGDTFDTGHMPDAEARRKAAKRLYSAPYGSTRENMLFEMLKEYGRVAGSYPTSFDAVNPCLQHPLVKELFQTREKLEAIITSQGGLEDATGRFIPLSKWDGVKDKENRWRGVMAYVNASYEQQIMASIFEEAEKEMDRERKTRFKIWLYQGDGVTIRVHRDYSHSPQIKRLQDAADEKADELGVPTKLEIDYSK